MKIFYLGYPGNMGGANTELYHTAKLWRQIGIDVTLIPTWGCDAETESKMTDLGCETIHTTADGLADVPGLAGSIAVGFCNSHFMTAYPTLKKIGCKTVWVNCMTFMFDNEMRAFAEHGAADAYMMQSEYQITELSKQFKIIGCETATERMHLIRGAFAFEEFPHAPRPHAAGEEFVIGRLSRPDLDKWSSNHWPIVGAVPHAGRRALCMGWTPVLAGKLGTPPAWAECLSPQQIPTVEFIGRCHAMIGLNGGARENWPRVGLEAMSAGVPLVCQNLWGWPEMIEHGKTGFLFDNDQEAAYYLARLAHDEDLRQTIIKNANEHVHRLADPQIIGRQWLHLFQSIE